MWICICEYGTELFIYQIIIKATLICDVVSSGLYSILKWNEKKKWENSLHSITVCNVLFLNIFPSFFSQLLSYLFFFLLDEDICNLGRIYDKKYYLKSLKVSVNENH